MKLSELMQGYTPSPDFEGWVTNDDFVLAINTTPETNSVKETEYHVVQLGIEGLDAQMNPITVDKTYIRAGQSTQRTGNQRSFTISGDRYIGDEVQDYIFSHAIKYGTGNKVITDYVYFCLLTGKGEKGKVSIIINSDGGGNAGESAAIDVEFRKVGDNPTEYTYSAGA
ncbi:phage tail tube protein [Faecalitalea cylindroides]|uniref:phage tail tube protein n=1 Tax=Faecalitalea cylindroides TaxID=39483 RepID=UPI002E77B5C9|nr:hypothetical protein [Faecalitalea cylindroides]MEE1448555.1 hypothetical protein [Faecalitalea cylindroides]